MVATLKLVRLCVHVRERRKNTESKERTELKMSRTMWLYFYLSVHEIFFKSKARVEMSALSNCTHMLSQILF